MGVVGVLYVGMYSDGEVVAGVFVQAASNASRKAADISNAIYFFMVVSIISYLVGLKRFVDCGKIA